LVFRSLFRNSGAAGSPVKVKQITAQAARERQAAGAVVVDVREPHEWREGHIDGAVLLPLSRIGRLTQQVRREQEVILVCRSGNRSNAAAQALIQAGYADVSNLAGGMIAWQRARLPVKR